MSKETKSFQAETKQLLELMIHSIYTHKDIFLRELISNSSDAIDKIKFKSLTDVSILNGDDDFHIYLKPDKNVNTLSIIDNGIGLTYNELVENLGTIAKSGSKAFVQQLNEMNETSKSDIDIIGQFGVGFYSAFMVANRVTVITKSAYSDKAYKWESTGDGTYTIEETNRDSRGTTIILELRENDADNETTFDEYTEEYKLRELIGKYSDYVRYPIKLDIEREEIPKDENGKPIDGATAETVITTETLNSMVPLWKKDKNSITDEEYNNFYKSKFHDWIDPLDKIHFKVEGNIEYTALLYIPSKAPFNFYSKDFTKNIQLYTKNIFIMDNCDELIPDHFRFVKGLVDSSDFSLNISREILQQNKQLRVISKNLEKKIISTLKEFQQNNLDKYAEFWKEFGEAIKGGIYNDFTSQNKEKLEDLLIFSTSDSDKFSTLENYLSRMKEGQEFIYYVAGENKEALEKLPQMELVKDKGFEVIFLLDRIDEFMIDRMNEYKDKKFKSITKGDLDFVDNEKKEEIKGIETENKDLLDRIKKSLDNKVSGVKISSRLKTSPVCIVTDENGLSLEMEKIMSELPNMSNAKANKILEINPSHSIFTKLKSIYNEDQNSPLLDDFSYILYNQALLIEGFKIEDPVLFSEKLTKIMVG